MNSRRLEKKEKIVLYSGLFLIVVVLVFIYFLFIQPLKVTVEQKENELSTQQKLLEVIEAQDIETSGDFMENTVNLQKQIPVEPLLEQFIIDLEMAETVSNSQILSISIADEGAGVVESTSDPLITPSIQPTEGTQNTVNPNEAQVTQKPEGIKEMTLSLSIQSGSYFDLEKFVDTLETLDRIVEVNSVSFSGPPEISSLGTGTNETKTNFQLSLSIFYFPKLQDLVDDLPELETESPANKSNPLSSFPDVSEDLDKDNTAD